MWTVRVKAGQSELNGARVRNTRTPHERANTPSRDLLKFILYIDDCLWKFDMEIENSIRRPQIGKRPKKKTNVLLTLEEEETSTE